MTARTALLGGLLGVLAAGAVRAGAPIQDDAAAQPRITGTVSYRERIALPPDASVQVRLDDVSQPEAAPRRVAEATFPTAGKQVPIPFELPYSAADIVPGRRYTVRAKILADGKTLFSTKTPYPVITRGAPTQLEILVQQAAGGRAARPKPATTGGGLTGVDWKLVALGTTPAVAAPQGPPAHLTFDSTKKSIAGSTGCNRFAGSFVLADRALSLNVGAMTMMACQDDVAAQEEAFVEALKGTAAYRLADGALELVDADGRALARFAAVAAAPATRSH
jgi:putative lipoprotein